MLLISLVIRFHVSRTDEEKKRKRWKWCGCVSGICAEWDSWKLGIYVCIHCAFIQNRYTLKWLNFAKSFFENFVIKTHPKNTHTYTAISVTRVERSGREECAKQVLKCFWSNSSHLWHIKWWNFMKNNTWIEFKHRQTNQANQNVYSTAAKRVSRRWEMKRREKKTCHTLNSISKQFNDCLLMTLSMSKTANFMKRWKYFFSSAVENMLCHTQTQ